MAINCSRVSITFRQTSVLLHTIPSPLVSSPAPVHENTLSVFNFYHQCGPAQVRTLIVPVFIVLHVPMARIIFALHYCILAGHQMKAWYTLSVHVPAACVHSLSRPSIKEAWLIKDSLRIQYQLAMVQTSINSSAPDKNCNMPQHNVQT